jgi:hypothetical protein
MTLHIIGAGFGRTGTLSLKAALEELGFGPCYHMIELFGHPEHISLWEAARRGEPVDWEMLFEGYRSTVDWPGCTFYKELLRTYPDAKVLLTVRDPGAWHDSVARTIYASSATKTSAPSRLRAITNRFVSSPVKATMAMNDQLVWKQTFGGAFEDRNHAIEVFNRHNEEVTQHVPADQLLVYQVQDGWEPLCEFLGVDVPQDRPFPHLNDTKTFRKMVRREKARFAAVPIASALVGLGLARLLAAACRRSTERRSWPCCPLTRS